MNNSDKINDKIKTSILKEKKHWTKEQVYEEAKKYTCRSEFERGNDWAYKLALKNNWMNDFTWFIEKAKPKNYWNYDTCMEASKQFTRRTDFKKKYPAAYAVASKNNWLKDYPWLIEQRHPNGYWTYDKCSGESKKYRSRLEFEKGNISAYSRSVKEKWINDFTWLLPDNELKKYSVYLYLFNDLSFYIGLTQDKKRRQEDHKTNPRSSVFKYASESGLSIPEPIYLEDNLTVTQAQIKEDEYVKFYEGKEGYKKLNKGVTGLGSGSTGVPKHRWSRETCYKEAEKYNSRHDFANNSQAYKVALRNGWLDDYPWLKSTPRFIEYWTKDKVMERALMFRNEESFKKNSWVAWRSVELNGWKDELKYKGDKR